MSQNLICIKGRGKRSSQIKLCTCIFYTTRCPGNALCLGNVTYRYLPDVTFAQIFFLLFFITLNPLDKWSKLSLIWRSLIPTFTHLKTTHPSDHSSWESLTEWSSSSSLWLLILQMSDTKVFFFFVSINLKPRVEWYKSLWALNTSPPRNRRSTTSWSRGQWTWAQSRAGFTQHPTNGRTAAEPSCHLLGVR